MKAVFRFLWGAIKAFNTVAGFVLLVLLLILLAGTLGEKPAPSVPDGAALVFAPEGVLVERKRRPEIGDLLDGTSRAHEVLLRDAVKAIGRAAGDDRIKALYLGLDEFAGGGAAALHALADAIEAFRETGKPVIAYGGAFSQSQYFIAAHADEVWMHPHGAVSIAGYGSFVPHFAEALDKLRAKVHVFRVGTYKSAVEPFTRNDMSEEAKTANRAFLNVLWDSYLAEVTRLRGLEEGAIEHAIAEILPRLRAAGGDAAQFALSEGWVDELKTRAEVREAMVERVGEGRKDGFRHIDLATYLLRTDEPKDGRRPVVAVVSLRGAIVPGKAPIDQIGAESAVALLDEAREDDDVKAVVLRVDSPGGSAFASELIRQATVEIQQAGKPVVVSMGSVAASGGYWISATADEIWAAPETITGSIGIFGLFLSLEDSLDALGIHVDGVGTTPLTGAFDPTRDLSETAAAILQTGIEEGYRKFLALVAEGRGMTPEEVDAIAQGRVWAGLTAHEIGLVDELGGLEDAIASAAALAGLEEGQWRVRHIEEALTPFERFLLNLLDDVDSAAFLPAARSPASPAMREVARKASELAESFAWLSDPRGAFALCLRCEVR